MKALLIALAAWVLVVAGSTLRAWVGEARSLSAPEELSQVPLAVLGSGAPRGVKPTPAGKAAIYVRVSTPDQPPRIRGAHGLGYGRVSGAVGRFR